MSPARRRACIEHVARHPSVSERKACVVLGQHRSTQRKVPRAAKDEAALTRRIAELARRCGRYGYRRITALLRNAGWAVTRKRVELASGVRLWIYRTGPQDVPQWLLHCHLELCWKLGDA